MLRAGVPCFAPVLSWSCVISPAVRASELRAAIHVDGIAGNPPSVLRGEERHNRADIIRLADPLERLHAENEGLALVGLDEVRHVGVDHARRDRVNADAVRPEGRDENYAAALAEDGKQLLHQEIRRADVDCEELIEILDRRFLDGGRFRNSCIGDKDVQAISDNAAGLPGKLAGAVRGGEVHRYGLRSAAGFAYLCDNTAGFIRAAAVVNEHLSARPGEGKRAGTAHAARGASDKGGLARESGHDLSSFLIVCEGWSGRDSP